MPAFACLLYVTVFTHNARLLSTTVLGRTFWDRGEGPCTGPPCNTEVPKRTPFVGIVPSLGSPRVHCIVPVDPQS